MEMHLKDTCFFLQPSSISWPIFSSN